MADGVAGNSQATVEHVNLVLYSVCCVRHFELIEAPWQLTPISFADFRLVLLQRVILE